MSIKSTIRKILLGSPNEFEDLNLRSKFKSRYNIDVGMYSYGCFDRSRIDPNTTIGRYCSFSKTAEIFNRNHGVDFISTTPYLYNSALGLVSSDTVQYEHCQIGDDVWIGHNASILPSARIIGRGAVVAAGAVVTQDVPPYAIVAGVPAKIVKFRFSPEVIEKIEESRWWMWNLAELRRRIEIDRELLFSPAIHFSKSNV